MKRVTLVLALILALTVLPGPMGMAQGNAPQVIQPVRTGAVLDAAFESGSVALVETENAGFDLAACEVVFPDNYWTYQQMEKPSESQLAEVIERGLRDARVISVSPSGQSALLVSGDEMLALNGATIAALCPSETAGVADEYGNLQHILHAMGRMLGNEGVTWSHDGRYAVITSINRVLMNMQLIIDPVLIDTVTGELIITATYPQKIMEENAGAMTAACFSADDRYLYYAFYGNMGEHRYSLLRCDLATCETELLYNGEADIYFPQLRELRDGSFIILSDTRYSQESMGVACLSEGGAASAFWAKAGSLSERTDTGKGWRASVKRFDLPLEKWRVRSMEYAPTSGWAVLIGTYNSLGYALQRFCPDEDFDGIDQRWLLRADTLELVPMEGAPEDLFIQTDGSASGLSEEYLPLLAVRLSPDGRYALMQVGRVNQISLLLVRLEDMKTVPVAGIPQEALQPYGTPLTAKYAPGMEWNADQLVLLADGEIRTYRFDTQG